MTAKTKSAIGRTARNAGIATGVGGAAFTGAYLTSMPVVICAAVIILTLIAVFTAIVFARRSEPFDRTERFIKCVRGDAKK